MSSSDKVDTAMLEQLKELLGDRFVELVDRFVEDGGRRMGLLQQAVPSREFQVIHAEAHGLKGSSRNIGANPLGDLCANLEDKGRTGDESEVDTIFAAIEQEFAAVCEHLKSLI